MSSSSSSSSSWSLQPNMFQQFAHNPKRDPNDTVVSNPKVLSQKQEEGEGRKRVRADGDSATATSPRKTKKSPKKMTTTTTKTSRTQSFGALWAGTVDEHLGIASDAASTSSSALPKVHTLILGTHPSVTSLKAQQYYAHPQNAFWWIAGDCLGFRRDTGISKSTGKPFALSQHLWFDESHVLDYPDQVRRLTSHGFALWDVVESCERPGSSLDCDIRQERANLQIRDFCRHFQPRRIVFANGQTSASLFVKHFRSWLDTGELVAGSSEASKRVFGKFHKGHPQAKNNKNKNNKIECICAISVSPAAAKYSYQEKRDFWKHHCYDPGLEDYRQWLKEKAEENTKKPHDEEIFKGAGPQDNTRHEVEDVDAKNSSREGQVDNEQCLDETGTLEL